MCFNGSQTTSFEEKSDTPSLKGIITKQEGVTVRKEIKVDA